MGEVHRVNMFSMSSRELCGPKRKPEMLDGSSFVAGLDQNHIRFFTVNSVLYPTQDTKPIMTINVDLNNVNVKTDFIYGTIPLINLNVQADKTDNAFYSMLRNKLRKLLEVQHPFSARYLERYPTLPTFHDTFNIRQRPQPFTTCSTVQETKRNLFARQPAQKQDLDLAVSSQECQKLEHLASSVIAFQNELNARLLKRFDNSVRPISFVARVLHRGSALSYNHLLRGILKSIVCQRYAAHQLCHFLSVESAALIQVKECWGETVEERVALKQGKDCSVDKDPVQGDYDQKSSFKLFNKRHQIVLNVNQDLVNRLISLQEHLDTNLISCKLNSTSAISCYRELVKDLATSLGYTRDAATRFFAFDTSPNNMDTNDGMKAIPPRKMQKVPTGGGPTNGFSAYCSSANAFSKLSLDSVIGWGTTTT